MHSAGSSAGPCHYHFAELWYEEVENFRAILPEFSRDGQNRDKGGADYVAET